MASRIVPTQCLLVVLVGGSIAGGCAGGGMMVGGVAGTEGGATPTGGGSPTGTGHGGASGSGGGDFGGAGGNAAGASGTDGSAGVGGGSAGTFATGGSSAGAGGRGGATGSAGAAGSGGSGGASAGRGGAGQTGGSAGGAGNAGAGGRGGGASGGTAGATTTGATIVNDVFWKDTAGDFIYSQGGGALRVGDTYYWYGVKYGGAVTYAASPSGTNPADDTSFQGITTYSSTDLVNWKLETLSRPANAFGWFGRLGVVYHAATKKYVLVAQTGSGQLYFATSDSPKGPFTYASSQSNLPGISTGSTGDQTMFQDDDGTAYLVSSNSNGRGNRYLSPLRASDYLAVENAIPVYSGGGREGNCMFKYEGTYYFCSSDLHGWNSSHSYCVSSSSTRGPWSAEFVLDGTDNDFSHVTQTGFFISVQGTDATTIIFAGDRWSDFAGNGLGYNQWVPLSFTEKTPHFNSLSRWTLNAKAGTWSVAKGNNYALNPSFEADRVAMTVPAGWKSTSGTNVQGGHTGRWSWQISANGTLEQRIGSLPAGTYTLSVWVKASGSGTLYTKGCGGTDASMSLGSGTSFRNVSLPGVAASGGACTIGVTAGSGQVTVDDFVMSDG